jgi:hypothetical protein
MASKDEGEEGLEGPFCSLLVVAGEVEYHHHQSLMILSAS